MAEELQQEKKESASKSAQQAQERMNQAGQQMKQEDTEKAGEEQERAKKNLNKLERDLKEERKKYEQMRQDQVIYNLLEELKGLLSQQKEIRDTTVLLEEKQEGGEKLGRNEFIQLKDTAKKQAEMIAKAEEVSKVIGEEGSVVFAERIQFAADDMSEVERRLNKRDTGDETQQIEEGIEKKIGDLITALKDEQKRRREEEQNGQQDEGDQQQMEPKILPKIAELKALRDMQVEVRDRTDQLSTVLKRIEERPDLDAGEKDAMKQAILRSVEQTSHQQGKISELTKKFIEELEGGR